MRTRVHIHACDRHARAPACQLQPLRVEGWALQFARVCASIQAVRHGAGGHQSQHTSAAGSAPCAPPWAC